MGIEEAPFANYESLLLKLPKFPVGFRGQPAELNQITVTNGFDMPINYYMARLTNLGIDELKKIWPTFKNQFRVSMGWGQTLNEEIEEIKTVKEAVSYFTEHPTEYSSVLVLVFPEITDLPEYDIKNRMFFKQKLAAKNVAGVIHAQKEDFVEFKKNLQNNLNSANNSQLTPQHLLDQHLENKMLSRYLEFLVNFKANKS